MLALPVPEAALTFFNQSELLLTAVHAQVGALAVIVTV
jgi:hypothetical protein